MTPHEYSLKIYNGRVKVYVDGFVMVTFNQIDYKGFYAFKDDQFLYGIDFHLLNIGGPLTIETSYKTKENWLAVLKLLDESM